MKRRQKLVSLLVLFAGYLTVNLFYNKTLIGKIAEVSLIVLVAINLSVLLFKK